MEVPLAQSPASSDVPQGTLFLIVQLSVLDTNKYFYPVW